MPDDESDHPLLEKLGEELGTVFGRNLPHADLPSSRIDVEPDKHFAEDSDQLRDHDDTVKEDER